MKQYELSLIVMSAAHIDKIILIFFVHKHQWCARVIFVESASQALCIRVESESSKIFSSQSHDLVESGQSRMTKTVESLRVIGLQARVNFESYEISHFFYYIFYAMKWCPTSYKMAPDKLENGGQHAIKWHPIC